MGKSASDNSKKLESHYIKNLAYYYSKTYSIEEAANKIDLDQAAALELSGRKEFKDALREINPTLLASWEEGQEDNSVSIHVRAAAKRDGEKFYKMMVSDLEKLEAKDRIPLLEKLLRLGGYFDKEEHRETITLSPSAVAAIRDTAQEMDTPPDKIKGPYDA